MLFTTLSLLALLASGQTALPYQNPQISAEERARDLVSRMTDEEKIAQCMMDAPAIPRLGVPKYHYWSEALHGIANNGFATVFPQAVALAATWNPDLMHDVSTVISTEARAKYHLAIQNNQHDIFKGITLWSPNINIFRDPRWGRGQETYGEDPFLTSRMGVAFVRGIQGDDPRYLRAVSTPKHFAVHSGPEPLRHGFDANVTEKELRETYLPAFEACVREGRAASVMSAYSGINGIPDTGNPWLLTTLLRDEWGFNGAVVSDVDSVGDILYGHHAVKDLAEASAMALKAGNDECSGGSYKALSEALKRGLITQADLNRAATRLFTLRFRLGMFDDSELCAYNRISPSDNDTPAHEQLALKAAKASLVLLKNDGILPLQAGRYKHVAVIGPVGRSERVLVGNYNGIPARPVTLFRGIQSKLEPLGATVEYGEGSPLFNRGDGIGMLPRGSLFADESRQTPGFKTEVFDNVNLSGNPVTTRIDRFPFVRWNAAQPAPGIPVENCSIRWSGYLVWPSDQNVTLGVAADDGVRLYINDGLVIDQWTQTEKGTHRADVAFKQGQPVKFRLEYFHRKGDASLRMGGDAAQNIETGYASAEALAKRSDLVILTLGISPELEGEEMPVNYEGFRGGDRTSIMLPKPQVGLMQRIAALHKPTILVLTSGSALALDPSLANGILLAWYPGEQGGNAVASALVGETNPARRLPVTFYRSDKDLPPFEDYHLEGRTYRYFTGRPLFPFGYGLSYAAFQYGQAKLTPTDDGFAVTVPVKNTSARDGDEVVEVYARYAHPEANDPIRRLVGFQRVSIPSGQQQSVTIAVTRWALRRWNASAHHYEVRPDTYTLEIGPSSAKTAARLTLAVK